MEGERKEEGSAEEPAGKKEGPNGSPVVGRPLLHPTGLASCSLPHGQALQQYPPHQQASPVVGGPLLLEQRGGVREAVRQWPQVLQWGRLTHRQLLQQLGVWSGRVGGVGGSVLQLGKLSHWPSQCPTRPAPTHSPGHPSPPHLPPAPTRTRTHPHPPPGAPPPARPQLPSGLPVRGGAAPAPTTRHPPGCRCPWRCRR